MNERQVDTYLANALDQFARPTESEEILMSRIDRQMSNGDARPRRGRRPVVLAFAAICVLATATVAAAQSGTFDRIFGDDPDAPANQISSWRDSDTLVDISAFNETNAPNNSDDNVRSMLVAITRSSQFDEFGEPLTDYARMLLETDASAGDFRLAAVPTETGNLCIAWATAGVTNGATCIDHLGDSAPISVMSTSRQDQATVFGVATDNVRAVTVKTADGSQTPATLGDNAYVWRGNIADAPISLDVRLTDGSVVTERVTGLP